MEKINLYGFMIANIYKDELLGFIDEYSIILPLNLDVMYKLKNDKEFYQLFMKNKEQTLLVLDSNVIRLAMKPFGIKFKSVLSGSEIFPKLCVDNRLNRKIFLMGAEEGVAKSAKEYLDATVPNHNVVAYYSPSIGFEEEEAELEKIRDMVKTSSATFIGVALGAPKQEKWCFKEYEKFGANTRFMCIGATLDFMSGNIGRCPSYISGIGMEWLYRLLREPKRLFARYVVQGIPFFIGLLCHTAMNRKSV